MVALADPARSEAVLVGVHDYVNLEGLPAVARNVEGLRQVLTDPAVWGLPAEACTVISQPGDVGQVLDTVREKARRASDTLLVYYAGHGLTDPHTDELYLALPHSDREREYTSLRYEYLRRAVLDVQASTQRTVLILDCCYSGRALIGSMGADVQIADQAVVEGTCLLTASAETRPALSPPGETYTAFTGELIAALNDGIPGAPDLLDMDTLFRHLHGNLASKSRPLPQQRNRNTGGLIAVARNRAAATKAAGPVGPTIRQSEIETRLAEMEKRAEEAERRALEMLENARRLASAVAATPDAVFAPFWFAVPVARPLMGEDGSLSPIAGLAPGIWYLAVGKRGDALVAQSADGLRGLLLDTTGIERGDGADAEAAAAAAAAKSGFEPYWFAVPVARPLLGVDDPTTAVAELAPGTWYLAVGRRGDAILAQAADGKRGLLFDTTGIQRGDEEVAKSNVRETLRAAELLASAVAASPETDFEPFWFAVPVPRPLMSEDGSMTAVAELAPGTWYLAVGRRDDALVAQTADRVRGLLLDTTGIQRG